jgi:hypothetical protein
MSSAGYATFFIVLLELKETFLFLMPTFKDEDNDALSSVERSVVVALQCRYMVLRER